MNAPFGSIPFGGAPVDTTVRAKTFSELVEDDLKDVFCNGEPNSFSVQASIEPAGETAYFVPGIFDKTPVSEDAFGSQIQAWVITFTAREATVRSVRNEDKVVINQRQYVVRKIDSDGTGVSILTLTEAVNG